MPTFKLPGVAFAYKFGFRMPDAAISAAQEAHAAACEKLGLARCRINSMTYELDERDWVATPERDTGGQTMAKPVITAYDWVPDFAQGQVRDLRVRWALEEVGQPYDVRYLSQGTQKAPPHRAIQPFGQVPTYQDGDLTLFESGAIVLHVAGSYPGLMPSGTAARARAIEWAFAALNTVEPPIMDHAIATLFEADKPWSKPRLPAVNARIDERLGELSDRLGDSDWLDGDFTAGDLLMIAVLRIIRGSDMLESYPNLTAYVARGETRPAFQRALANQMAGFTGTPPPQIIEWLDKMKAAQTELQGEKA